MTEPVEVNETPESTEETAEQVEAKAEERIFERVGAQLKKAGEAGQKQWEETLAKTREFLTQNRDERREEAAKTMNDIKEKSQSIYSKAQERGANLLLDLVIRLRKGMESLESSLKEAREEAEVVEEPAESEGTPATA